MRAVLFAMAAVFIFLGAASLLSVFMMPWLLAYGFSAPAALLLMLGGVLLLALAALLDGLHRVESAIYGLQQSLRAPSMPSSAQPGPQMAEPLQAVPPSPPRAETRHPATMPTMAPPRENSGPRKPVPGGAQSGTVQAAPANVPPPAPAAGRQEVTEGVAGAPPKAQTAQRRMDRPASTEVPGASGAAAEGMPKISPERKTVAPSSPEKEMPQPMPAPEAETKPEPEGSSEPGPEPEAVADSATAKKNRGKAAPAAEEEAAVLAEPASPEPSLSEPASSEEKAPPAQEESPGGEKTGEGGFLYIVREEMVRGRRARVLSDGTIEAELDEGWLRFENMDHLNEYLDALEELRKKGMI